MNAWSHEPPRYFVLHAGELKACRSLELAFDCAVAGDTVIVEMVRVAPGRVFTRYEEAARFWL